MTTAQIYKKNELRGIVRTVYKQMGRAIQDYQMLAAGDKVLVGVSGGADSLSLLKLIMLRKEHIPVKNFEFIICFVDTDFIHIDRKALFDFFNETGFRYVVKPLSLHDAKIDCFWCSWNRRKILFETARDLGCNKVCLGHNLDDVVETTILNMCFHGEISTMKPCIELFEGRLSIIRPLCYVAKKTIVRVAETLCLPVTGYVCPHGSASKRAAIKDIVRQLEMINPDAKKNIFRALKKINTQYLL